MQASRIVIGEYYRHSDTPKYCWAKALEVIPPRTGVNTHGYFIVRCEWSESKKDVGLVLIKYFKASDLMIGQ